MRQGRRCNLIPNRGPSTQAEPATGNKQGGLCADAAQRSPCQVPTNVSARNPSVVAIRWTCTCVEDVDVLKAAQ
jgi:hypothetical protein